ncbi:Scr1 family TA system antitoxin-like transcriptional regulator [Streptomyces sp. L7]
MPRTSRRSWRRRSTPRASRNGARCSLPGLLQTPAYARAVILAGLPCHSTPTWRRRSTLGWHAPTSSRRTITTPAYWVILHESLLTEPLLEAQDMTAQLDRIAELADRRRITPQIVPRKQRAYPLMAASILMHDVSGCPATGVHRGVLLR